MCTNNQLQSACMVSSTVVDDLLTEKFLPSSLADGETHVWHFVVDRCVDMVLKHTDCLSGEEIGESNNLKFKKNAQDYLIRHILLRKLLASYLGISSRVIEIKRTEYGKPYIQNKSLYKDLQFNLSKSNNNILISLTQGRCVGCDIEKIKPQMDYRGVLDHYFTAEEIEQIIGSENEVETFFQFWAAKEAYIKAIGQGLSLALDSFSFKLRAHNDVSIIKDINDSDRAKNYEVRLLDLDVGYTSAIAVENGINQIKVERILI